MYKKLFLVLIFLFLLPFASQAANGDYRLLKKTLVDITCAVPGELVGVGGSGVIVSPDGKIITNAHVAQSDPEKTYSCTGGFITDTNSFEADFFFNIDFFYVDTSMDIAFGEIDYTLDGKSGYLLSSDILAEYDYLNLEFQSYREMPLWLLGYPGITKGSLNITEGEILFKELLDSQNYLFTDAVAFEGNSGGAAVDGNDALLGLTTSLEKSSGITDILDIDFLYRQKEKLTYYLERDLAYQRALDFVNDILRLNNASIEVPELHPDIQGRCMENAERIGEYRCQCVEGYLLYSGQCVSYEQACQNWYGSYSYVSSSNYLAEGGVNLSCACADDYKFNNEMTACVPIGGIVQSYDLSLAIRVAGKLLLQVEDLGRIWYTGTEDYKRYEITKDRALDIFRKLALGISNGDLACLPFKIDFLSDTKDSDFDGHSDRTEVMSGYNPFGEGNKSLDMTMAKRLSGKLLLQVEDRGRIWYVYPETLEVYEVTRENLMDLFRSLSLGITNNDLNKIEMGGF